MNPYYEEEEYDYGAHPHVTNVEKEACKNRYFRKAVWTGKYLQMTLMSIPPCGEIGQEVHEHTDQMIRVESGEAILHIKRRPHCCDREMGALDMERKLCCGDTAFIPAGTWHNIHNAGREPLKISSIYAPPNHPHGSVQKTAQQGECREMF